MNTDRLSTAAEELYRKYANYLTINTNAIGGQSVEEHIEGKDYTSCIKLPAVFADGHGTYQPNKNVEIKAIRHFLSRDNNPRNKPNEYGTLSFEIFQRWYPANWDTMYSGWTRMLFDPDGYNELKKQLGRPERIAKTGTLAFILYDKTDKPFASIAFEDIPKLREVLTIAFPRNWELEYNKWDKVPPARNRQYWDGIQWDDFHGGMIQNVWHIPTNFFVSHPCNMTVTMINERPAIASTREYNRYQYLRSIAVDLDGSERRINTQQIDKQLENLKQQGINATPFKWYTERKE